MSNHGQSTVLNLQRFVPGGAVQASDGQDGSLTASIQRGAQAVADAGVPISAPPGIGLPPVQLLGALSYCYAKGVCESTEIESRMWHNAALRAATHDNIPGSSLLEIDPQGKETTVSKEGGHWLALDTDGSFSKVDSLKSAHWPRWFKRRTPDGA